LLPHPQKWASIIFFLTSHGKTVIIDNSYHYGEGDMAKQHRLTKQRKVVLEELRKVTTHPSADEVYEMVRRHLPRISLGTVYRNLEVLYEVGQIQRLTTPGVQMRFDGNPQPHYHLRCTRCGRIDDVDQYDVAVESGEMARVQEELARRSGFEVSGHSFEFMGVCPACKENAE
jgi:Fur family ferric uptake transcriptional regulator